MAKTVEAIFENGVFKPLGKKHIKEHEKVKITISYLIDSFTKNWKPTNISWQKVSDTLVLCT